MSKMTPGKWEVVLDTGLVRESQNYREIAHCKYGTKKERHANAQAIAALPELVEAAEQALAWINSQILTANEITDHDRLVYRELEQVLNKIEGKE